MLLASLVRCGHSPYWYYGAMLTILFRAEANYFLTRPILSAFLINRRATVSSACGRLLLRSMPQSIAADRVSSQLSDRSRSSSPSADTQSSVRCKTATTKDCKTSTINPQSSSQPSMVGSRCSNCMNPWTVSRCAVKLLAFLSSNYQNGGLPGGWRSRLLAAAAELKITSARS